MEAFNRRLELVAELKRVKEEHGLGFLDPAREEWLRAHLEETNRGPLSREGLNELVTRAARPDEARGRPLGGSSSLPRARTRPG